MWGTTNMASVITTITGLQNLPNLQNFNADFNGLQTVDVSGLTNLTTLDISDCDDPSTGNPSLTSVNVTGCTALTELRVDDSAFSENGISSITGLSDLTNLQLIDLDECGLSGSIDLSMLPSLRDIDVGYNDNLTEVVISSEQPIDDFTAYDCSFSQETVDNIILTLSENGVSTGSVYMTGIEMATISAETIPAVRTLAGNGWNLDIENYSSQFSVTAVYETQGEACADSGFGSSVYTLTDTDVEVGNYVYDDDLLVTPIVDGWFKLSEDNNVYQVSGSGLIVSQSTCV